MTLLELNASAHADPAATPVAPEFSVVAKGAVVFDAADDFDPTLAEEESLDEDEDDVALPDE